MKNISKKSTKQIKDSLTKSGNKEVTRVSSIKQREETRLEKANIQHNKEISKGGKII